MNQILQVKETSLKNKSKIIKKILLFLIIILTIIILAFGGYYIYLNIGNGNIQIPGVTESKEPSIIKLTKINRNKLILNVQNKIGISKIMYKINNGDFKILELSGETVIEETINMPTGKNSFYISAIDIRGNETTKQEDFEVEGVKPDINLAVVGNDIKISVNSEVELSEVTYQWNSEAEKTYNIYTYENRNEFEKQLEIPIGSNTLKVVAIDITGSKTEKIQEIKGVTKATTKFEVKGKYLHFTVTGKENIEKVEFEFNKEKYVMDTETFGETKVVHYKVKLVPGTNYLKVISKTQSGGIDTQTFEQKYTTE